MALPGNFAPAFQAQCRKIRKTDTINNHSNPSSPFMTRAISFALLATSLLTFGLHKANAVPPSRIPADMVALTAWLEMPEGTSMSTIVEVHVNGTKEWGRPDENGRVELLLPANEVALIHFRQPGFLVKSVKVDTHNMNDGSYEGKGRSINIGVKMETSDSQPGLAFAGPVGMITFAGGTGELMVEQDHQLIPVERRQTIMF
jgi:hypothetical protein